MAKPKATPTQSAAHFVSRVTRAQRQARNGHRAGVLWLTGLSAAGKTTLAQAVEAKLFQRGCQVMVLDGDRLRQRLCRDLDFTEQDRRESIRRAGEVAKLFATGGFICVVAMVSPYRADRDRVRKLVGRGFVEVFVNAPLGVCEARDPKGLYARARAAQLSHFTGINAPYERPLRPEITLRTDRLTVTAAVHIILRYAERHFGVPGA